MPSLADLLENYRNWKGRQDWQSGKEMQDYFGGDPVAQEQFEQLSGFGTDAGVGGVAGTFIGRKGAERLGVASLMDEAEKMHAAGAPREEIWSKTLSMLAPNKQWIHEIPDTGAEIIDNTRTGGGVYLKHPLLQQAHPEQTRVKQLASSDLTPDMAASFTKWNDKLDWDLGNKGTINYPAGVNPQKEDFIHEFQHWVQSHPENKFPEGGNPAQFNSKEAEKTRDLLSWRKELEQYMQNKGYDPKRNSDAYMNAENSLVNEYYNLGAHEFVPSREIRNEARQYNYRLGEDKRKEIEDTVAAYGLDKRTSAFSPTEMYKKLWGEAQARLAEKRMDYTPEQRKSIYPWEDLDVPEEELIDLDRKGLAKLFKR